jgi:hypothetical protein
MCVKDVVAMVVADTPSAMHRSAIFRIPGGGLRPAVPPAEFPCKPCWRGPGAACAPVPKGFGVLALQELTWGLLRPLSVIWRAGLECPRIVSTPVLHLHTCSRPPNPRQNIRYSRAHGSRPY